MDASGRQSWASSARTRRRRSSSRFTRWLTYSLLHSKSRKMPSAAVVMVTAWDVPLLLSHMTRDFNQGRTADELAHPDYQGFRLVCDIPSPMAPVVHGKAESSPTRSNEMRDFSRQAHQCHTSAPLGAFSPEALGGTLSDGHLHTSARRGKGEVHVVILGFRCARVC